ncbi:hypothetical protein pdam_00001127 [Pocillopora damicornis]|uniref:Uncharacterized protein n=1 Tax=Pocillopora damicornis TaxID=46731 RepID=A0A3M6V1V9_POCDA|nr:hypothetical protein pdam_00001127 [Pocillopora damicornis]
MMASNVIITSVIIAVFLVGLAQKGLSLSCYKCYSTISWEDCFNKSTVVNCESNDDVCFNTYTAVKQKDDQQKLQFSAYCDPKKFQDPLYEKGAITKYAEKRWLGEESIKLSIVRSVAVKQTSAIFQ